jgi:NADH:ubiquinone oxidoreductase subunit 5 (subunit L)/multisubunit Na+/H+ antiporter MnhA subunit
MFPAREDLLRVAPELVLCLTGILLMVIEPFLGRARRTMLVSLAGGGAGLALAAILYPALHPGSAFGGLLRLDGFSIFFHALVGLVALLVVLGSSDYLERENIQHGEYYALVLFATAGMGVMASASELMTAFIGLEISSISTYILAGYRRDAPGSTALRRHGQHAARSDDANGAARIGRAVAAGAGAGAGRPGLQGGRRAVPALGPGRLPGRADAGPRSRCC